MTTAAPGTRGPDHDTASHSADVERIEHEITHVNALRRDAAQLAYDKGLALRALVAEAAHRKLGYSSFESFVEQRMAISGRHARRLIGMVEHLTLDQVLEFGSERACAVIQYARARGELELIHELLASRPFPGGLACTELSCRAICAAAKAERARRAAIQRAAAAASAGSPTTTPTEMGAPQPAPPKPDTDDAPQSWIPELIQIFAALGVTTPSITVNDLRLCVCLTRPQITALSTHVASTA